MRILRTVRDRPNPRKEVACLETARAHPESEFTGSNPPFFEQVNLSAR